jgi:hypothetical protein
MDAFLASEQLWGMEDCAVLNMPVFEIYVPVNWRL